MVAQNGNAVNKGFTNLFRLPLNHPDIFWVKGYDHAGRIATQQNVLISHCDLCKPLTTSPWGILFSLLAFLNRRSPTTIKYNHITTY